MFLHLFLFVLAMLCSTFETKHLETPRILNDWENELHRKPVAAAISSAGKNLIKQITNSLNGIENKNVPVLIYDEENNLKYATTYIQFLFNNPYIPNTFSLITFNNTGISEPIRIASKADINRFIETNQRRKEQITTNLVGTDNTTQGGVIFYSISQAIERTQLKNGAIMIFTDKRSLDEDLTQVVFNTMQKFNNKLLTVWQGIYPTPNGDEAILETFSHGTKGMFFVGNTERNLSSLYYNYFLKDTNKLAQSIIYQQNNIVGRKAMKIPVDNVEGIHLSLSTTVTEATFIAPNGYTQLNILRMSDLLDFSQGSFITTANNKFEIHIYNNKHNSIPFVGVWRLETDSNQDATYNVTISVQNSLILNTTVIKSYGDTNLPHNISKQVLRLHIKGKAVKIDKLTFTDTNGDLIKYDIPFEIKENVRQETAGVNDDVEIINEVDVSLFKLPEEPVYIKVNGKDEIGTEFIRLSYFDRELNNRLQSVTVEVGVNTKAYLRPNVRANIYFEVTNNRDQMVFLNFGCHDEKRLLAGISTYGAWLSPQQSVLVTVYVATGPGGYYEDLLTFTASSRSGERYHKRLRLSVDPADSRDDENPHMWHKYTSDCLKVLLASCHDASWSIEVTAQDRQTGLLQLFSSPNNLFFPHGYVSGTKDEVVGLYQGSCCHPYLHITSVDLNNNRRTYVASAYADATLGPGAITSIVFGVIILIAMIILCGFLCRQLCGGSSKCPRWLCCCCRPKNSASVNISESSVSYRGPANSSGTPRY